jgi:hypothetical protein
MKPHEVSAAADSATMGFVRCRASAFFLLLASACPNRNAGEHWTLVPAPDLGERVATVAGTPVFAKQVAAKAKATNKSVRQALDEITEEFVLAELARQRGSWVSFSDDPDIRSAMVQRLLERELEPNLRRETLPDSALRPIYEKTLDHFVHSRLIEIAVLAVYTGPPMQKEDRDPREQTARDLAAFLKSHAPKTLEEFEAVAGEPKWKERHVTLRRFEQGLDRPLSASVGVEAAKLHVPGDTTPLVIDQDGGFIARYVSEKPSENISFAEARGTLVDMLYEKLRQQQFMEFTGKLGQLHRVQANFDGLSTNEQGL